MIEKIEPFAEDEKKTAFKCGPVYYYEAVAGSVLADHTHEAGETLWIVSGHGQILIGEESQPFEAPCEINIPPGIHHKFMPETDVKFIELRHEAGNT